MLPLHHDHHASGVRDQSRTDEKERFAGVLASWILGAGFEVNETSFVREPETWGLTSEFATSLCRKKSCLNGWEARTTLPAEGTFFIPKSKLEEWLRIFEPPSSEELDSPENETMGDR